MSDPKDEPSVFDEFQGIGSGVAEGIGDLIFGSKESSDDDSDDED